MQYDFYNCVFYVCIYKYIHIFTHTSWTEKYKYIYFPTKGDSSSHVQ